MISDDFRRFLTISDPHPPLTSNFYLLMTDSLQSLRNFHRAPPKIGHHLWRLPKAFEWKVSRMWHFWPSWLYSKSTNYIRGLGPSPALSIVMDRLSTSVPSWTNGYQARNRAVGMYYTLPRLSLIDIKVNSVQEACSKCSAVHMLEFEILQITWKKMKQRTSDPLFSDFHQQI